MKITTYCVYMHTLLIDGRKYIGITKYGTNPEKRWGKTGNGYKNNEYFYRAIKKYGWDAFKHEVVFESLTKDQACAKEIALIKLFNTTNSRFGFNLSNGGDSSVLYHMAESTREKIKVKRSMQTYEPMPIGLVNKINTVDIKSIDKLYRRESLRCSAKDTSNYVKEQARRKALGLSSLYTSGKNNGMYGKGYLISGGNNGHANIRYFFKGQVFESRKELIEYLHNNGYKITSSALRRVIRGIGTKIVYDKYKDVFDNLNWELKHESKEC